jgi:hypothetical protein
MYKMGQSIDYLAMDNRSSIKLQDEEKQDDLLPELRKRTNPPIKA